MNALKPDAMTFHWEFTFRHRARAGDFEGLPFARPWRQTSSILPNGRAFEDFKPYEMFGAWRRQD